MDTKYFVHLLDAQGNVIAQEDGVHVKYTRPSSEWQADEMISDLIEMPLWNLPPGEYRISAGLTNPDTDAEAALFAALMVGDPPSGIGFAPPSVPARRAFDAAMRAGLDLMQRAAPALWGEFRGLVRHVICVRNPPGATMQFDGGSHYQLWGALFLNVNPDVTPDAMVEVLAHESAHSLLFGLLKPNWFRQLLVLSVHASRPPQAALE